MIAKSRTGWFTCAQFVLAACLLQIQPSQAQTTIRYAYDDANRMVQVTAPAGRVASYSYDSSGRQIRTERKLDAIDGVEQALVTHHKYDPADRTIAIAHVLRRGATERVVAGQAITRLAGGVITRIDTFRSGTYDVEAATFGDAPAVTQTFKYNANASLVEEARTQGAETNVTQYEYDVVGNRLKKEVLSAAGTAITHYTYDRADRLVLESTTLPAGGGHAVTYTWDGNGNLASKTEPSRVTLYRFDPQNRLIDMRTGATQSAAQAAAPAVRYAYDAQGNRVRKWAGAGSATGYLIDPTYAYPQVAMETTGNEATGYVWGRELLWQTKYGGMNLEHLFPLPGHLGTSLGAVDAKGVLVESVDHDAYGELRNTGSLKQTHIYTGEYWDGDSKLLYLRARWYDPKIGRFISADPFEGRQSDPRTLSRYAYAHNDPVHALDPTGRMTTGESLAVLNNISMAYTAASIAFDLATGNYVGAAGDIATDLVCAKFGKTLCQKAGRQLSVFCNAIRCSRVVPHLALGSSPSGASLSKNLELIGIRKPSGSQAHHIVGAVTDYGQRTRSHLAAHNISVNSPANGVFLPGCGPTTNVIGMIHCGRHTELYEREVFNRIQHLNKREDIISVLDDIRRELLSNNFVALNVRALQ